MVIVDEDGSERVNVFHSRFALNERVMAAGLPARIIAVSFTIATVTYACMVESGAEVQVDSSFVQPLHIPLS